MPKPSANNAHINAWPAGSVICQTGSGSGRHCQYIRPSTAQVNSTNVLRSMDLGTKRVHQALKPGRAMIVCCTAKSDSSRQLMPTEDQMSPGVPESIALGTPMLPTKPIAYRKVIRNRT